MSPRKILSRLIVTRTLTTAPQASKLTRLVLQTTAPHRFYSKCTAVRDAHHHLPSSLSATEPLSEERALNFITCLNEEEREAIKKALEKFKADAVKEKLEGQLAATTWRSRFGKRTSTTELGDVDPTGSYCAMPEDWLKKKLIENAKEPTTSDLSKLFFVNAVPFLAFGFLDNFTMIIAGEYIEEIFGMYMCISTMAAAGLGNTISDVLGIGSAYYVERFCEVLGLRPPRLTPTQLELSSSRRWCNWGRIMGITIGCLIGMTPLLWMEKKDKDSKEKEVIIAK